MNSLPTFKEAVGPLENLNFTDACVTTLNDFKLSKIESGLKQNISNISIILKKNDKEMEEFLLLGAKHFTGSWWAKITGGHLNFIEDNYENRTKVIKMYEKINNYKIKDIIKFCLSEWVDINTKYKIFPFKLSSSNDFFKKKDTDSLALNLWWIHYYTTLLGCHNEPNGMRKILSLKKSFLGKWSKESWIKE